ncbi:MAG: 1-(5-phosphoribosyl)-5-[(5-phosphoribosylamino)methylideneamino]imidazole-4-carboxamide isomerase [Muribaculum sp.]|nr:1-(5-phosphoribosyl)-5-[(5-phosphoribosylamino)methylideneamino]imidazole-4-carboxamide isomerase [Muribaculum sp.]
MIDIIPAIDIIGGKCVRLTAGDYSTKKVYGENPAEQAKRFADVGCSRLHVVDLDGAKASHIVNYKSLEQICRIDGLDVDFGGGIKSDEDIRIALDCGAKMVTGGSIAVKNPEVFEAWIGRYGSDVMILGADARNRKIASNGWLEDSDAEIIPFVKYFVEKGVSKVISTDISTDGMLCGPSVELYRDMLTQIEGIYLIASGGVGDFGDVLSLEEIGVPAVIVGKAIYEHRITLSDIERYNSK